MPQHRLYEEFPVERYRPRSSGIAFGIVIDALDLRDLPDPLAQRWFLGEAMGDAERGVVAGVIARAFVAAGIRVAPGVEALDEPEALRDSVLHFAEAWEALRAELEREALDVAAEDGPWLAFGLLRLVAIDLAVRGAAAGVLARGSTTYDAGAGWSLPRGYEPLMARARVALALRSRAPEGHDEPNELGDQLEAGLLRVLERAEHALAGPTAPRRPALLELVRRGTRASAAPRLVERLQAAEPDPLWATDLRAVCGSWPARLVEQARRLAGDLHAGLEHVCGIVERAHRSGVAPEELEALRVAASWVLLADRPRDVMPAEGGAGDGREPALMLPVDDHPPERARMIQRDFVAAYDELDGTLEHGRCALELAPDDPALLVGVGALLAERACEQRYAGWEYHVDVGLALLRRATWIEPRWDRPWVEIAIVLASLGAWDRARRWLDGIPAGVRVTPRLVQWRALLLRSSERSA
jgi:hypothetical protein